MPLSEKQRRFVAEYLVDLNATQAAIRAGYSKKAANKNGPRLLVNAGIAKAIEEGQKKRLGKLEITSDRVLGELARLAFFDPRNFFNADGSPKKITELDEDTAMALAGMDIIELNSEDGPIGQVKKFKLADKRGSLELLGKHLRIFTDRVEASGPGGHPIRVTMDHITDTELDELIYRKLKENGETGE